MIRRFLDLPADAGLPISIFEPRSDDGLTSTVPPGPEREAALKAMKEELGKRAAKLEELAAELLELVAECDPTQLIPSISVPASAGLPDATADDDATHSFSWDAKIEYILGLALAGPPGSRDVDEAVTKRVIKLLAAVFDAAHAQLFLQSTSEARTAREGLDAASFMLRLEHLFDRMDGYAIHLEEIANEVFDPHREFYVAELGFCPSDAVRLVRRHTRWVNCELNASREELFRLLGAGDSEAEAAVAAARFKRAMEAAYLWRPELLAESTSLPEDQVQALLLNMSADFGCQPSFRLPSDENRLYVRPLVRLSDDSYLAAVPWSVAHGIHRWMQAHNEAGSRVAKRYEKHRGDAAERLVRRRFEQIFGEQVVFANQHYDSEDGHGEIDCLVAVGRPIVTEVKSHALTDRGRRGHRPRIERVADAVVSKSFQQTQRARAYVEAGGRCFADRQGAEATERLPAEVGPPLEVVITLERMDPVATGAGALAGDALDGGVWVTNLADLLMVCDTLPDPASLLHYVHTRCTSAALGIQIYVESDALGGYLVDRLSPLIAAAAESTDGNTHFSLDYSSTEINRCFTLAELGLEAEAPETGVPESLLQALRASDSRCAADWAAVALSIMAAPRGTWRRWRRFVRRHKGGHPFLLPSADAAIAALPKLSAPEIRSEPVPTLAVPRDALISPNTSDGREAGKS